MYSMAYPFAVVVTTCLCVVTAGKKHLPQQFEIPDNGRPFRANITKVSACATQARRSLCVTIDLNVSTGEDVVISCQKFDAPQRHTPPFHQVMFGLGKAFCDMSRPCHVNLYSTSESQSTAHGRSKDTIRPDSTYFVFCGGWRTAKHDENEEIYYLPVEPRCTETRPCGVRVTSLPATGSAAVQDTFGIVDLASVLLLIMYICWSFIFKYVRVLHETGFAVLVGVACGLVINGIWDLEVVFSYDMFSLFLLPMVIFSAGWNLQKKDFFRHSIYIFTLGVSGTVLIFVSIFFGSAAWDFKTHAGTRIPLTTRDRLIMATVLASTDSVAPMAFLPAEQFPRIFAVVFGEGVLNDVVSILLSTATASSSTLPSLAEISGDILYFFATSSTMGAFFGFAISYGFRSFPSLQSGTIKPSALIYLLNYSCYVVTDLCGFSSIFALFICALLCGHYARYSLSEDARVFANEFAETLSYIAEAFVFGYFGLTAVTYLRDPDSFSLPLIVFYVAVVVVVRFVSVAWLALSLRVLRCGQKLALDRKELCVIALAGCMRGTIAFALILRAMPPDQEQTLKETVLISTVLGIVLINCLVFGGLFPLVLRCLGISGGMKPGPNCNAEQGTLQMSDVDCSRDSPVASRAGSRRPSLLINTQQVRHTLHGWWHKIDDRFLKPTFRPPVRDEED